MTKRSKSQPAWPKGRMHYSGDGTRYYRGWRIDKVSDGGWIARKSAISLYTHLETIGDLLLRIDIQEG